MKSETVDCERVQQSVLSRTPLSPEERAHVQGCEACAALLEDDGATARRLSGVATDPSVSAPAFETMMPLLNAERSPLAWLRNQPTPFRLIVPVVAVALVVTWLLVFKIRPDLNVYPVGRMLLATGVFVLGLALTLPAAIWPAHVPQPSARMLRILVIAAGTAPLVISLLPAAHSAVPVSSLGVGQDWAPRAIACFLFGTALALPAFAAIVVADRGLNRAGSLFLAAAALGLAANLFLQLHCPLTDPRHLVAGHGSIGAVALLVVGLVVARRRRS